MSAREGEAPSLSGGGLGRGNAGEQPPGGLTRRRSLQALALTAGGAVTFAGCVFPDSDIKASSRPRLAEDILSAYENWYATGCAGCSAGCGAIVRVVEGRVKKAEGNPAHPVNWGKLCARGQAIVQEEYHPDRVTQPLARGSALAQAASLAANAPGVLAPGLRPSGAPANQGPFRSPDTGTGPGGRTAQEIVDQTSANKMVGTDLGIFGASTWDESLDALSTRLRQLLNSGQGNRVAVLTPPLRGYEATVVDRFTRALGARWLRHDPLPELPLRAASRLVFGQDQLPAFDVARARYLLSFGTDFLTTWLSPVHYGVQYGIFRQGVYRTAPSQAPQSRPRGYMVQVSPQFSGTTASADEWVPVTPGTEGMLALSIAQVMVSERQADPAVVQALGDLSALDRFRPETVATLVGVRPDRIRTLAHDFATRKPALAIGGGQAGAHTNGTLSVAAILLLNVLAGNVGQPGGVQFSPTSAPPADARQSAPASSLVEWQQLVERLRAGDIDTVLVYNANPVYGLPAALGFESALRQAPFIVSFSSFIDETTVLAHRVLPSHLPLERWGDDVPEAAYGASTWTLRQPVAPALYDTRSFWDVLLVLAEEVSGPLAQALPWPSFKEALRDGARTLYRQVTGPTADDTGFERFWTQLLQQGGWWQVSPSGAVPASSSSATSGLSGSALQAARAALQRVATEWTPPQFAGSQAQYPYALVVTAHNSLDDGRAANLPWLQALPHPTTTVVWQSWVEINPTLAAQLKLREGDLVSLKSPVGQVEVPVYLSPAAPPTVLTVTLGQGHLLYGRWAAGRGINPMLLLAPLTDPLAGSLAYSATGVSLTKTGRSVQLPKYEGQVPARQLEDRKVLKITSNVEHSV